jgi:hypothetical protein
VVQERLDGVVGRLDRMEERLDRMEERLARMLAAQGCASPA